MRLCIEDSSKNLDIYFGEWLIELIQIDILSKLNKYKFEKLDKYLNSYLKLTRVTTKDIIRHAVNHLRCDAVDSILVISFDNNIRFPMFNNLKLASLIRLIDSGSLSVKGCRIFSNCFNKFEKNIPLYINMYNRM